MKKIYRLLFVILLMALIQPSSAQKREHRKFGSKPGLLKSSHESSSSKSEPIQNARSLSAGRRRTGNVNLLTVAPNYYVSGANEPWGSASNTQAMDNSFGTGNWSRVTFDDVDVMSIFNASTEFIFLEGSDGNANELNAFLTANLPAIEAWVSDGGRLLLNAAPNQGGDINFGFDGTTLRYENGQSEVSVVGPILEEPYSLTNIVYTGGSYSHAHITGDDLRLLIVGSEGVIVLAEKLYGEGLVTFGGMTQSSFHDPQPDAEQLRANILYHVASISTVPSTPEAAFRASRTNVITNREVSFIDLSTNFPTNQTWTITPSTFEYMGGTNEHSSYPKVRFTENGTYTIKLTASNNLGQDEEVKVDYIHVTLPVKFYWVGGDGVWSDYANHWATSSGGNEFHDRSPFEDDNVFFDENSFTADGQSVNLENDRIYTGDFNFSGVAHTPEIKEGYFTVTGSLIIPDPVKFSDSGFELTSSGNVTVDLTGADMEHAEIEIDGKGSFDIVSPVKAEYFRIAGGTVTTNGHTITVEDFYIDSDLPVWVDFGNSELHVTDDLGLHFEDEPTFTGNFKLFLGSDGVTSEFRVSDNLELSDVTLLGDVEIYDNITFGKLIGSPGVSINLQGNTLTSGTIEIKGTDTDNIIIANGTLSKASGTVVGTYLQLTDIIATGGASFYADKHSVDNGGNTGWIFSTKEVQDITFGELADKVYGAAPFNVSATSSSSLTVVFEILSGPATLSENTVTITGAGEIIVRASQEGDNTYIPAQDVLQSVTVDKAVQNLSFTTGSLTFGQAPVTITTIPGESGNDVVYSIVEGTATVTGSVLTITGAGTIIVKATQDGNDNYEAAELTKEFVIAKAAQTIQFIPPTAKTFGDAAFNVTATGGASGNTVTFSIVSGPATVTGTTVTLSGAGPVTIKASQTGNANYLAANVEQVFCVNPVKPAITATDLDTETPVLTSTAAEGYQWFNNGTAISGATGKTYTVTEAGIYSVATNAATCMSVASDAQVLIVTGIEGALETYLKAYPNPVIDELVVDMTAVNSHQEVSVALYDVSGRLMNTAKGKGAVTLPMQSYRSGQYAVVVGFGAQKMTKHIIKK